MTDHFSADTFLQLNDGLNTVLNRYDAFKRGDYVAASNPVPPELASNASAPGGLGSLIDLDDNDALASLASPPQQTPSQHIMNNMSPPPPQYPPVQPSMPDLFSLLDGTSPTPSRAVQSPYGQNGGPSYGSPHSSSTHPSSSLFSGAGAAGSARSTTPSTPMGTITLPGTPGRMTSPPPPLGYGAGIGQPQNPHGNNPTMGGWMGMNAPQAVPQVQTMQQQQQQRQQQQPGMFGGNGSNGMGQSMQPQAPGQVPTQSLAQGQQGKDPFADLAGIF
jgi:ADP-ribosylation factor-binding protein GGA